MGWSAEGASIDRDYEIAIDRAILRSGKSSLRIECVTKSPVDHASIFQRVYADRFAGRRVRYRAYLRSQRQNSSELMIRTFDKDRRALVNWVKSNRSDLPSWTALEIVLDVPEAAARLEFGLRTKGGVVWIDDVELEAVGNDVPVTEISTVDRQGAPMEPSQGSGKGPENLDFEKVSLSKP